MGFGTDCIANHFLKIGLPVISDSLCDIFNLSIATGVFPVLGKLLGLPLFSKVDKLMIGLTTGLYLFSLYFREFLKTDLQPTL